MSSIWRQVVILIRLYWIWSEVSADGETCLSNAMLTWNESRKYCEDIGKVLFDAKKNDSEATLRKFLKDTNQAWVSARVEFSHFVKPPVCTTTSRQFAAMESFDTDIIGNCLKFCNGYRFAGVKDKDCYCFKDTVDLAWSNSCNSTCSNDPFHQCGGKESMSLYDKADETITNLIAHGCKDCVYNRDIFGDWSAITGSCVSYMADGAICEQVLGKNTACGENKFTIPIGKLCVIIKPLRWKQANQYCADIGGNLVSSGLYRLSIHKSLRYWYGFYRIPMIHNVNEGQQALELVTKDTCCAVARRVGDIVLIEGDDCRAKHAIICQDESLERSSASPQSTEKTFPGCNSEPTDERLERSSSSPQSTHKPFPGCDSECTDANITYGMVAVSAMLLVALIITSLVCVFRRRQVSQESVNDSTTRSTREQHVLLERQITNPPSQPSRHIYTENENLQSSYLTVYFDRGRQDGAIQQPGCSHFD